MFGNIVNSFRWVSIPAQTGPSPPGEPNIYGWSNARNYQYTALTASSRVEREKHLAAMLYTLGHVIHLNQDLSQPGHVRNDEHNLPWHAWIEKFGEDSYLKQQEGFPIIQRGWDYWRDEAGFNKLRDFWDRGNYMGNASALKDEATNIADEKLGLAEFSNGNFLSEDASYAEYFKPTHKHYFPFPSIKDTDQSQLKLGRLVGTLDTTTLRNGKQGQRSYLKKSGAGVTVTHHSAVKYLAVKNSPKMGGPSMRASLTINDTNVLQDYHSILIPKAIEYSAGILDYFFRGQLEVSGGLGSSPGVCRLKITNKSGQDFHEGAFGLFWDNPDGDRTEISSPDFTTTYEGTLAHNDSITAEFTVPEGNVSKYILVYQGTIGTDNEQPSDPVDGEIAIAVKTFTIPEPKMWLRIDEGVTRRLYTSSDPPSGDAPFWRVDSWADQSGFGNDATQPATDNKYKHPLFSNGAENYTDPCNWSVHITGANDGTGETGLEHDLSIEPPATVFFVAYSAHASPSSATLAVSRCLGSFGNINLYSRVASDVGGSGYYGMDVGGDWIEGTRAIDGNEIVGLGVVGAVIRAADDIDLFFKQVGAENSLEMVNRTSGTAFTSGPTRIGNRGTQHACYFNNIYEVLVFDEALNDDQRDMVIDYLSGKYPIECQE